MKRGQVSMYVFFGLVVLITAGFFISTQSKSTTIEAQETLDTLAIESFVNDCVQHTANDALEYNGLRGGYYDLPEQSTQGLTVDTSYYPEVPTDEILSQQIGLYVSELLPICLEKGTFHDVDITYEDATIESQLNNVRVLMKTTVTDGDSTKTLESFSATIDATPLVSARDAAQQIANTHSGGLICVSCLDTEHRVNLAHTLEGGTLVELEHEDYTFRFALQ